MTDLAKRAYDLATCCASNLETVMKSIAEIAQRLDKIQPTENREEDFRRAATVVVRPASGLLSLDELFAFLENGDSAFDREDREAAIAEERASFDRMEPTERLVRQSQVYEIWREIVNDATASGLERAIAFGHMLRMEEEYKVYPK